MYSINPTDLGCKQIVLPTICLQLLVLHALALPSPQARKVKGTHGASLPPSTAYPLRGAWVLFSHPPSSSSRLISFFSLPTHGRVAPARANLGKSTNLGLASLHIVPPASHPPPVSAFLPPANSQTNLPPSYCVVSLPPPPKIRRYFPSDGVSQTPQNFPPPYNQQTGRQQRAGPHPAARRLIPLATFSSPFPSLHFISRTHFALYSPPFSTSSEAFTSPRAFV